MKSLFIERSLRISIMSKLEAENFCPQNRNDWRFWLMENHLNERAIWLEFYKKDSPQFNLSWSDAVEEALCFGWIDSIKQTVDNEKYRQYFTQRKPKSMWSKVNKDKVEGLIRDGQMMPAGFKSIEIAKKNGSWSKYDDVEKLLVPKDLEIELTHFSGALDFFHAQSKSIRKGMLFWVADAKRPETRLRRIQEIARLAGKGLKPKQFS